MEDHDGNRHEQQESTEDSVLRRCFPIVALDLVMNYLSVVDMVNLCEAVPWIHEEAMSGANRTWWVSNDPEYPSGPWADGTFVDRLLMTMPPVDALSIGPPNNSVLNHVVCFRMLSYPGDNKNSLMLCLWGWEGLESIVGRLIPRLRRVHVCLGPEDLSLATLSRGEALQAIYIFADGTGNVTGLWPQDVVLPRLRRVDLGYCVHSKSSTNQYNALLETHGCQLEAINVFQMKT